MSAAPAFPPVALTMGEPAGIGGEIALKAWRRRQEADLPVFFLIDDPARLRHLAGRLKLEVPVQAFDAPAQAAEVFSSALPVLPQRLVAEAAPGRPSPENAGAVLESIDRAVALAQAGEAAAVVTNPIYKKSLYEAGFHHPGHTEYLAALAGGDVFPVMMLACQGLRVVPVTVHLSLRDALAALSREHIVLSTRITAEALRRDFGIARPRLAVAALNPHAGEEGGLGREELDVIGPAVAELRAQGLDIAGPAPADSLFRPEARRAFDAVICMYHDQALIPLKTLDFEHGVNVTLGLPFVRTSPDHGTALSIAGTGRANETSLIAALVMAAEIARRRAAARARMPVG